jgi:hypothetical protein
MLGGFGTLSSIDIAASKKFLLSLIEVSFEATGREIKWKEMCAHVMT